MDRPLHYFHAWETIAAVWGSAAGVEEAKQALGREAFPWYDKSQDALRPMRVTAPWDLGEASSSSWSLAGWARVLVESAAVAALVGLLLAIVWLLVRAYLRREERSAANDSRHMRQTAVDDAARIEALPFRIRRGERDLLAEARRLYEQGQFGEAVVYLFSHQLVELDRRQAIRLAKGKTNRQYLRELRRSPALRQIVEGSMVAFEDVFFGGHAIDRTRFELVWRQLDRFASLVAQQERA